MNRLRMLVMLCLVASPACIDVPDIEEPPQQPAPEPQPEPPLEVRLTSPGDTHYTNGDVPVQVVVSGGDAEKVELLLGEEPLVTLSPPYHYTWSTQGVPEGRYSLVARASREGERFTSEPRTVIVDRTPPQVVSRTPSPGAQDVSVHAPIRIEFSEPLLRSSVTEAAFEVSAGGEPVGHTLQLSEDGRAVSVLLARPPPVPSVLSVTVASGVRDVAGNLVPSQGSWSWRAPAFLTIAPHMTARGAIKTNDSITMDVDRTTGDLVVAWSEHETAFGDVFVRRWNGSDWSEIENETLAQSSVVPDRNQPQLLIQSNGQPVIGFRQNIDSGAYLVRVFERTSTSWQQLGSVGTCSGVVDSAGWHTVALGAEGQLFVAFNEVTAFEPSGDKVYVCQFVDGAWKAVGPSFRWSGSDSGPVVLDLEVDVAGMPVVLWAQGGAFFVDQWNGTEWTRRSSLTPASGSRVIGVSIAMGRAGSPYVAWTQRLSNAENRLYVTTNAGGTIVGQLLLTESDRFSVGAPRLRLDEQDNPVVVWQEFDSTTGRRVLNMQRWLGAQWDARKLVSDQLAPTSPHRFVLDSEGAPVVALFEHVEGHNVVALKRYNQ